MSAPAMLSRAAASPTKLASEPPPTRSPLLPSGIPVMERIHSMTRRSSSVADGAERHAVTFWFSPDARKSARVPASLPPEQTYPKNRGESFRRQAGWNWAGK